MKKWCKKINITNKIKGKLKSILLVFYHDQNVDIIFALFNIEYGKEI